MQAFKKADILIPQGVDFSKWSVVACDQYTSEPEYWKSVEEQVGDSPSALKITFPEIYLPEGNDRIEKINNTMEQYINDRLFTEYPSALIYVEREIPGKGVRRGIVGAIDLEEYDFSKGSQSQVRATEGTVLERIPPRVKIRENAPIELPHILILIDDEKKEIIESLNKKKSEMQKLYDFDLMQGGGHLAGYLIPDTLADAVLEKLEKLSEKSEFAKRYGIADKEPLTYAVGDGNHSLATAKTCWENIKSALSPTEQKNHPARFALCELENIHDDSLEFEPIHRVLFGINPDELLAEFKKYYKTADGGDNLQCIEYITEKESGKLYVENPKSRLTVGTLQIFLDEYLKNHSGTIDYIHGDDVCRALGKKSGNIGFILPAMQKSELFAGVVQDGALPRKTFSMGEAFEKRFYLEGKKIR